MVEMFEGKRSMKDDRDCDEVERTETQESSELRQSFPKSWQARPAFYG